MSAPGDLRAAQLDELYGRLASATGGQNVPCVGRDEWTSRRAADRELAVASCSSCPAVKLCRAYAAVARVDFGVWGGQDWTPRLGRPRKDERVAA